MPLHSLEISTRLLLHAEFVKAPVIFAIRHNVDLADGQFAVVLGSAVGGHCQRGSGEVTTQGDDGSERGFGDALLMFLGQLTG